MHHATGQYGLAYDSLSELIKDGSIEATRLYLLRADCAYEGQ